MDKYDMYGWTDEAMAKAVEQADIVLVCFSSKYRNSPYCRAEAGYAFDLGKTIIPLKMEMDYKPDGWLGLIISSKKYYDFGGKYTFGEKVNELIRAIQTNLRTKHKETVEASDHITRSDMEVATKIVKSTIQQPHRQNSVKISELPFMQICICLSLTLLLFICMLITVCGYSSSIKVCSYKECDHTSQTAVPDNSGEKPKVGQNNEIDNTMNWTLSQVEKWLNDKVFQKDMFLSKQRQLKALRGKDVAFLKLLVHECPNTFYQTIREQLGIKDVQSMSDFRFALEDIDHVDTDLHSSSKQVISTRTVETTKVRLTI
ncbi:uncharacterized protein LOC127706944 [Mytilus californianus]|uniref:uncharacterized protein LOC127706944 n=1 Tax=Mytilus californianus TaxID=6549 RepID=UPI002248081D|nr:uncharacterized protein LOC127706944 [Mytilus californianus]XP_052067624.1 uncharacterized protein LOC127706944 [Mytilus californianus]